MESVPDLSNKWDQLKDLLRLDPEFQARNPDAYELLFEQEATRGVYLPSFGIRVLDNSHQSITVRRSKLQGVEHKGGFADAYSFQHVGVLGHTRVDPRWPHELRVPAPPGREEQEIAVTGRFPPMYDQAWYSPLDPTDLQGLLLAVLSRDDLSRHGLEAGPLTDRAMYEAPPVRITDLRLAVNLFDAAGKVADKRMVLRPLVETLPTPLTRASTIQWKHETLQTLATQTDGSRGDPQWDEIRAVSFVAAALCLFLDLGGPALDPQRPLTTVRALLSLAEEIRKVMTKLNRSAEVLASLVANRPEGRQKRSDFECLFALSCYRMGYELRLLAERNGINPFHAQDNQGTKNWRKKVMNLAIRGVDIEREHYRLATEVFDNGDDVEVSAKAEKAYLAFAWASPPNAIAKAAEAVGVNTATEYGSEVVPAYVQLGSCKYHNIPHHPTSGELG